MHKAIKRNDKPPEKMNPQELLSKYIQNTLTPEEKMEFDRLRSSDEKFNKDILFHNDLKKVTEDKDDDNFREMLSELEGNVTKKKNLTWWYIAASALILLGITYFIGIKQSLSNDTLFAQYFEPYRNITQPVVRSDAQESIKEAAFHAYENGQFQKALNLFDQVLLNKEEANILFYKANVLLSLNQPKMAVPILQQDISVIDSFSEKRYWYLALSYLKLNQIEKSKETLQILLDIPNSEYKKKEAAALLEKME